MKKQTVIRSVAIVLAGITASSYAAQHVLGTSQNGAPDNQAALQSQSSLVLGAGLIGGAAPLKIDSKPTATIRPDKDIRVHLTDDAPSISLEPEYRSELASLSGEIGTEPSLLVGEDFNPRLALADDTDGAAEPDCTPRLSAQASIDALVDLSLSAPCHPDTRLVISHDDLAFSAYTSSDGTFSTYLPALSADAKIDVFLSDDIFLQTEVHVADIEQHLRIVLQWTGNMPFSLHAYHKGASYGEDGHIHVLKPFDPNLDEAFLISLGADQGVEPMMAQVYSLPAHLRQDSRVELELSFADDQCGQDYSAFVLQSGASTTAAVKEVVFSTPDCPGDDGSLVMGLPIAEPSHAQSAPAENVVFSDAHQ